MTINNNLARKIAQPQKAGFCWILIICVIFFELLAYTWVRTESTQTILQVSRAQEAYTKTTSYHKALSVERDRLKSDERITRIAKTRLDLSTDTSNQTIYLPVSMSGEEG